ncbi:hypothetical protein H3Z85_04465 [Chryseobacterium indologenes]|uniref:hypothetical protein n=1 Tax=Chryseobacterium indologenes TaxID=253 RepID=UPI0003E07093|nr:hypothetical protein [Chryseobacterium indologenes]QPQ52702.1 hypothetical protein H3Z85_04465 [Chryseobacterium indologenes]GAE65413.1 hypothetical protein CIN01S_11_00490 [Chryseobacterium indologenes NBRC 14944]SFK13100.1 hypothetical protein SAMN05421692_3473 [Chryseobacterium indologenes]SUX51417.1 Uncharacterised protein [Chryseobacterium indologenes]
MATFIKNRNSGLKIGATFSLLSFLLTFTYLVPVFTVIPGSIIELIAENFVNKNPYSNVGKVTILIFVLILIIFLLLVLTGIKNMANKGIHLTWVEVVIEMLIFYFIIHPLGFYIYWGLFLDFRSDGQLIFSAITSFPYSSIGFIIFGILIDQVWKKEFKNSN